MISLRQRRWALGTASFYVGLTKSGFAGGTGIVITPLLAMVLPAKETIGLVLPLLFLSDVVNIGLYWNRWDWGVVGPVIPGAVVGILFATRLLVNIPDFWLKKTIGILALLFLPVQIARMTVWQGLTPTTLGPEWMLAIGLVAGFLTGIFSTMAHLGGVITTIYFLLAIPRGPAFSATLVGTATVLYFVVNGVKLITYSRAGIIRRDILRQIPPLLPILAVGLLAGKFVNGWFVGRQTLFIYIVLGLVAVMGWKLVTAPRPVEAVESDG